MRDRKTVRVRMAPGLTMPLPPSIVVDSNLTVLTDATEVDVVADVAMVRRRIAAGDFVVVPPPAPAPAAPPPPAAPEEE